MEQTTERERGTGAGPVTVDRVAARIALLYVYALTGCEHRDCVNYAFDHVIRITTECEQYEMIPVFQRARETFNAGK